MITRRRVLGVVGLGALGGLGWYAVNRPPPGKLTVNNGNDGDAFGDSVALSADGTTAVVGASLEYAPDKVQGGSAYVFRGSGRSKSRVAKLAAEDGNQEAPPREGFGNTVAISDDGTVAVVGALVAHDLSVPAYVFAESDGSWNRTARLRPDVLDDGGDDEGYGLVALSGDGTTALVTVNSGAAAYVFSASDGAWRQTATIAGGIAAENTVIALSNDGATAVVGGGSNDGRPAPVHVFSRTDDTWTQDATLAVEDADSDDHIWTVALSGDGTTALAGASSDDDPNGDGAGSAYVFSRSGDSWGQEAKLVAADGDSDDSFGTSVSLSRDGTTALVGARTDEDPHGERSGSAYMFSRSGGSWSQERKLTAGDGDGGDTFGDSVALSNDATTALVGAPKDEDTALIGLGRNEFSDGSAYVFTL